jgi:hypothetical protein
MDDRPGLFDLPAQDPSPIPLRSARGRARETFARTVVADVTVCNAAALRAHALEALERAIPIGDAVDDADLLDPEEEIVTSSAAALQWCLEPTNGMWPLLESDAVRIDGIDLATEERSATLVQRRRPARRSSGASRPLGTGSRSRARRWPESPA